MDHRTDRTESVISTALKTRVEHLYATYNKPEWIHPDPLEFVYRYETPEDMEIAGMIASSFAFGRVSQILKALGTIFGKIGTSPHTYLKTTRQKEFNRDFNGFVYRFVRKDHVVSFMMGLKGLIDEFGSLEACFESGLSQNDDTVVPAQSHFVEQMVKHGGDPGYLIAKPGKGSAMKRMNLFLRWMVRNDAIDPGVWTSIPPEKLIIPLDTHMHKIAVSLGLTSRKQADMKTALDITRSFSVFSPEDPVKYDFALTRFGIRPDLSIDDI